MIFCIAILLFSELGWTPSNSTLSVLTILSKDYGIKQADKSDLVWEFRNARSNGNPDQFGEYLKGILSDREIQNLRSQSFQRCVGRGVVDKALRENRIELTPADKADLVIKTVEATGVAESHRFDDFHSVGVWALEPIISSQKLLKLEGAKFKFKTRPQPHNSWVQDFRTEVNGMPIEVLTWPEVRVELKMNISQVQTFREFREQILKVDLEDIAEAWNEIEPGEKGVRQASEDIHQTIMEMLDQEQRIRFNQLLLQRYVVSCPPIAAIQIERMGYSVDRKSKEFQKRNMEFFASTDAAKHFRRLLIFRTIAEDYMKPSLVKSLMKPRYVPTSQGKQAVLTAAVFQELAARPKARSSNRRRERE